MCCKNNGKLSLGRVHESKFKNETNYVCKTCNINKMYSEFHVRNDRKRGISYICKDCTKFRNSQMNYTSVNIGNKTCRECNINKDINLFEKTKRNKDGRDSRCNYCRNVYKLNRLHNNIEVRITENLRKRIRNVVKLGHKSDSTKNLLGCSIEDFILYLESKFIDDMNWTNYGKWHIDHIKPCSSYDLLLEEEQRKCFHYTNMQPLWAKDNLRKGDKYE